MPIASQAQHRPPIRGPGSLLPTLTVVALLLAAWLPGAPSRAGGPDAPYPEYQVKAAFLYHFTKYMEWPPGAFASAGPGIVLGVLGVDPFQGAVEDVIRDRTVEGRPLSWKRFEDPPRPGECHVLFIGSAEQARLNKALDRLKTLPILTVGESEAFGRAGGIAWFRLEGNKLRFAINLDAARRAGLKISSRLLGVATVVTDRDLGAG